MGTEVFGLRSTGRLSNAISVLSVASERQRRSPVSRQAVTGCPHQERVQFTDLCCRFNADKQPQDANITKSITDTLFIVPLLHTEVAICSYIYILQGGLLNKKMIYSCFNLTRQMKLFPKSFAFISRTHQARSPQKELGKGRRTLESDCTNCQSITFKLTRFVPA